MAIERSLLGIALFAAFGSAMTCSGNSGSAPSAADQNASENAALVCRLSVPQEASAEGAALRFEIENRGIRALWFLRWNTPFDPLMGDVFVINAEAASEDALSFVGPMVKRGDPSREEYLEIPAGKTLSTEIDLRASYEFRGAGRYEVRYESILGDVAESAADLPRARDRHQPIDLACGPTAVNLR